jgi:uncharacterized protein (DUF1684 family)
LNEICSRSDSKVEIGGFEARHLSDAGRIVGLDIGVEMLAQARRRCRHLPNVTMEKQIKGEERDFVQWGEFRFSIGGEECVLQAYKSDAREEHLFIPFRDTTSGRETYGAGRYLDLDSARNRTADANWILDLNRACNPWCVYSESYTCPFVPRENWLAVPVRAGEKNYSRK